MDTIEKLSSPFSCTHSSWAFDFKLYFISPNDDVPLASPDPGTASLYPHESCYAESSGFCLVVADSSGVIDILHDSLKAATTLGQANSFVLNKALTYAKNQTTFSAVETFVSSKSSLSFINPNKKTCWTRLRKCVTPCACTENDHSLLWD
jgi:hypothetical protein